MNSKLIGGILLVTGTTIGGGMLALPITSAGPGFLTSSLILIFCWIAMLLPALLILEVNLSLPIHSNLISMAKKTLGNVGASITWLVYLLLLYSLLSVYVAGGTDLIHNFSQHVVPLWLSACLFVTIFGFIVYRGIQAVDYVNRGLMMAKMLGYSLLVAFTLPFIHLPYLRVGQPSEVWQGIMVMLTSFGFASIVPSLRSYFSENPRQLSWIIIIGSVIPLLCYLLWNAAIIGVLAPTGLSKLGQSMTPSLGLVNALRYQLQQPYLTDLAHGFVTICVLTSFLAVSIGLTDFLADGLKIAKASKRGFIIYVLAFLPPLGMVIFKPNLFMQGLHYAGLCCVILLMLLPVLMAWRNRYYLQGQGVYRVRGGKSLLLILGLIAVGFLMIGILQL